MPNVKSVIGAAVLGLAAATSREQAYEDAAKKLDWASAKEDIKALLLDSQSWWPADYGNYGPFFVRLAWHCSGSYRISDGRGGCGGGRQRFDPERSWDDNTNLDKARKLLAPIKLKYGAGLSWGDLFILTGTTAIETMDGPSIGFCGGRIDDNDGTESIALGPSDLQEAEAPCLKDGKPAANGECDAPLGATTVGLIYVNPQGPMGVPDPKGSAVDVRSTFERMAMNDSETVALIGGGHSFGKTHGACPAGAGAPPKDDPTNPWPGNCKEGTYTTGFEGPWTSNPTKFDNSYFKILHGNEWENYTSVGGGIQWRVKGGETPSAPSATGADTTQPIMMLTSDVSLKFDAEKQYQGIIKQFAEDETLLRLAFEQAWFKLTTRDMGPRQRCLGPWVPAAQPFQYSLPAAPAKLANFDDVAKAIKGILRTDNSDTLTPDTVDGQPYYGAWFSQLAYQCASTFRHTDYLGGCNGARIRLQNSGTGQATWEINKDMDKVLAVLETVKKQFDELSWADLITLAGQVALEEAGVTDMLPFCGGRVDAVEGDKGSEYVGLRADLEGDYLANVVQVKRGQQLQGLTNQEFVALQARPRGAARQAALGFNGTFSKDVSKVDNNYFLNLLKNDWTETVSAGGKKQFVSSTLPDVVMMPADIVIKFDAQYASVAVEFANDNDDFLKSFAAGWTKLAVADRFKDGPAGNVCAVPGGGGDTPGADGLSTGAVVGLAVGGTVLAGAMLAGGFIMCCKSKRDGSYRQF